MRNFLYVCCFFFLSCAQEGEGQIVVKDYANYFHKAAIYCKQNNLNQDFFILLDYAAHSGTDRFIIYDFEHQKVSSHFPVSHGCYNAPWGQTQTKEKAFLSNKEESHAASKGKYLITERGVSQWGIKVKYLLVGLEQTNNNALRRTIVLHSWEAVADKNIYPAGTPEGWGCPAISNNNMRKLDKMLKVRNDKTLLWAID
jgi:hypothetical protein